MSYKANKTLFYNANGTGRDGYIYEANGGHAMAMQHNKQPGPSGPQAAETHLFFRAPCIHSKPVQYVANGSGRDSYIQMSAGGLNAAYEPGRMVDPFLTGLRAGGPSAHVRARTVHRGYRGRSRPAHKTQDRYLDS